MRIARILTRLNLGGPARQVQASDPVLRERGHEVRLFAGTPEPGEGDLFEDFQRAGHDVVRVPHLMRGLSPLRDLRAKSFLQRALREFDPDVVHTHASKAGALGRRAAHKLRAGLVHTFHGHVLEGYFSDVVSAMLISQERRMCGLTDRVIAVSHATAEDLLRLEVTDEARLVVIPPGVDLSRLLTIERNISRSGGLRAELELAADDVLVGMLGRLAEVKRVDWGVDVFELLAGRYPKLHLAFFGDGEKRGQLERRVAELPSDLRPRVHVVGAREDRVEVLRAMDILLSTSRAEGMPVSMIEAAAAGIPTVGTPVGGVPELVANERTGYLGQTPDELAFGLDRYLSDAEDRLAAGHRARLRVEDKHSASKLADSLERVYEVVCEERR